MPIQLRVPRTLTNIPLEYFYSPPSYLPQNELLFGGSAAANAAALKDSWDKILAFFGQHL